MTKLKIGELAVAGGCQVETIRYYEREGLLAAPARSAGNYRLYDEADAERLTFIRHCRSLGMSLADVRRLLHFRDAPDENCNEVNLLLDTHIAQIGDRMNELANLQRQMRQLRSHCDQTQAAKHCGILQGLTRPHCEGALEGPDVAVPDPA